MSITLGSQSVGFVNVTTTGEPGPRGLKQTTRNVTVVSGGHFRPAKASEVKDRADVSTEIWKYTGPPAAAALAAKSTGEMLYDGTDVPADAKGARFQIDGPIMPKYEGSEVHHVVIFAKRQTS